MLSSPPSTSPPPIPDLERDILRMVLYFDVFRHPLTLAELTRLVAPGQEEEVERACARLMDARRLGGQGVYRFRRGREETVERRRERSRRAERTWPAARRAASVLARFPYVRGLLVTGSLSKNSASADGDVDWLILVEPGRVWSLKSLLQVFRRALPEAVRERFCTNYLLDTDHLLLDDRNLFTAVELATAVPVAGPESCTALLDANPWAARFVPGLPWSRERATHALPLPAPPHFVHPPAALTAALERQSRALWERYWDRKYGWLAPEVRSQRFKRRDEIATNHLHDFQDYVLSEVSTRMREEGLEPAVRSPEDAA